MELEPLMDYTYLQGGLDRVQPAALSACLYIRVETGMQLVGKSRYSRLVLVREPTLV